MISPDDPRLVYVDERTLTTPFDFAQVLVGRYWCWHPERGAILYRQTPKSRHLSPQCNPAQEIALKVLEKLYPWAEVRRVHVAYLRPNPD